MKRSQLLSAVLVALAPAVSSATDPPTPADLVHQMQAANTASERIAVLKDDSDFVFNFLDPKFKSVSGAGGRTVGANIGNFPALFGSNLAMTLGFMGPCSLNSPHTHPRATEILIMINGTIESGFLAENGARFVVNTVEKLAATVFPRGSIHFQANLGCEPVMFAAALNHEDPGTLQVAQRFFALPADVVGAALGGIGVQEVAELAKFIPDNLIQATEACFKQCNLPPPAKGSQPTKQQQAPASATAPAPAGAPSNAVPNGKDNSFEGNGTPPNWLGEGQEAGSAHGHGTHHPGTNQPAPAGVDAPKHNVLAADGDNGNDLDKAKDAAKGWFDELPHDGDKIAVLVLVVLNVAMLIGAIVFLCVRASRKRKLRKNRGLNTMSMASGSGVSSHSLGHTRNISGPRPLITSSRGKYAAAEFELPMEDSDAIIPRKYDDPYDKPPSRAPSPMPQAHTGPYRD